jgi:anti-sigma regulatory factor (Ser/Thr protein kinase)
VGDPQPSPVVLVLDAVPESVPVARHVAASFAKDCAGDPDRVALATSEAVTNAVIHAYRDTDPGPVRFCAMLEDDDLVITVRDEGMGMNPNLDSPGLGYGLSLIAELASNSRFVNRERGLEVAMRFPCPGD